MLRFVEDNSSCLAHGTMCSDAQRNRRRLLDAAVVVILASGGEPSRDAIAKRAGVGVGTLYRHFPDRQTLLRAVVLDVLDQTIVAGEVALAESESGVAALRRYLHDAIDIGLGVINIVHSFLDDKAWPDRLAAANDVLARLVDRARADGVDITAKEIGFVAIRFCRPLSVGLDPAEERSIAHRQLTTYLDGLIAGAT